MVLREPGPSIFVPEKQPTTRKRSFWIVVFRLTLRVRPHEGNINEIVEIGWIGPGAVRVQIYLYAAKSERDWSYDCL